MPKLWLTKLEQFAKETNEVLGNEHVGCNIIIVVVVIEESTSSPTATTNITPIISAITTTCTSPSSKLESQKLKGPISCYSLSSSPSSS